MREIRTYGSVGGAAQYNALSLPYQTQKNLHPVKDEGF